MGRFGSEGVFLRSLFRAMRAIREGADVWISLLESSFGGSSSCMAL